MQIVSELFYSIGNFFGGTGKQAQKAFFNNRTSVEVNSGVVRLNTAVPYKVYNSIPQFKIPVDKLAAMFANGVFKYQKNGSDKLENLPPAYAKLLENPNILNSQNPFMKLYIKQLLIYGNQYIYKNQASKLSPPTSLMCISPAIISPELTGKLFDQVDMDGIVKRYVYKEEGKEKYFETKQVLWSKIDDVDNMLIGTSPLIGLNFPISNTELAYKYLNCISGEKGNIGMISAEPPKDSMGQLPANAESKKLMETIHRQENGIEEDQKKIMFTNGNYKWTPMTYPTRDLLLIEQIDANFLTILHQLGVNPNLFINSTYENLRHGLVVTHNDTIVPYADGFTQSLTKFLGITEGKLVLDYSHLPYLQTDKASEASTFSTVSNGLGSLVTSGIINAVQANAILANQFGIGLK